MNIPNTLPPLEALKTQAKQLRGALEKDGRPVSHARALELLAGQFGYRDWNTLHAAVGNQSTPAPFLLNQRVTGTYLNQAFTGEVIGIVQQSEARYRITFLFDEAVDVVKFEGMSNLRKRVTCTLDCSGRCADKTSDGVPHMQIDK